MDLLNIAIGQLDVRCDKNRDQLTLAMPSIGEPLVGGRPLGFAPLLEPPEWSSALDGVGANVTAAGRAVTVGPVAVGQVAVTVAGAATGLLKAEEVVIGGEFSAFKLVVLASGVSILGDAMMTELSSM